MKKRLMIAGWVLLWMSVGLFPADATVIHVDVSNVSGIEDGTAANPFNTIQEGVNAAVPGDEVVVEAGLYLEDVSISTGNLVVRSSAPRAARVEGSNPFIIANTSDVSLEGFDVFSSEDVAVVASNSFDCTISKNKLEGVLAGVQLGNASQRIDVVNNVIVRGGENGIFIFNSGNHTIRHNTLWNNSPDGIFGLGTEGNLIISNIIAGDVGQVSLNNAVSLPFDQVGQPQEAKHILVVGYANAAANGAVITNLVTGDPAFVDEANDDFQLTSSSAAIDQAAVEEGVPADDHIGNPRDIDGDGNGTTISDIGAYEFQPAVDAVDANIRIEPATINSAAPGLFTVFIESIEGALLTDVNLSTIRLEGVMVPVSSNVTGSQIVVKFNREDLPTGLTGPTELTVTGELNGGTPFTGSDSVNIL